MTTDNDAAKALTEIEKAFYYADKGGAFSGYGQKKTKEAIETIRTALAKSAKVDGLLEALNKITRVKTLPDHSLNTFNLTTVHLIANEAIQRFNGEV